MDGFAIPTLGDLPAPARHAFADKVADWRGLLANLLLMAVDCTRAPRSSTSSSFATGTCSVWR